MMNKDSVRYFFKIGILLLLLVLVDFSLGQVLKFFYSRCKAGVCYQENYIINNTSEEVLILGSSRAAYHYIPQVLNDSLDLTVYNAGREGSGIYFHYGILISTLKRYKPKAIILDLDYRDIYVAEGIFGKDILKELYPFYGEVSGEFDSLLRITGTVDKIKLLSNTFRYNTKFFRIITGNIVKGRDNRNGFRAAIGKIGSDIKEFPVYNLKVDYNKLEIIEKMILKCQKDSISLILSASPLYYLNTSEIYEPISELSKKYSIPFINHIDDIQFINNSYLFKDELHLNVSGAKEYTAKISSEISDHL